MLTIDRNTNDAKLESTSFNLLHPVGTPVYFSNGDRLNGQNESVTKSKAYVVREKPFILLQGVGSIPLSRVTVK